MNIIKKFFSECAYSQATEDTYSWYLTRFLADRPDLSPDNFSSVDFRDWIDNHQTWGGNSKHLAFCAIRVFLRWRYGDDHPALKYKRKRERTPPQRSFNDRQIEQLYTNFDTSGIGQKGKKGVRDLAILSVMLDTGLRASEVCHLQVRHIYIDFEYSSFIQINVKGGDWDTRSISVYTALDLENWLAIRKDVALPGVNACFVSLGSYKGQPLTRHGLRGIVRKWGLKSEVGHMSPHDFKRSGATLAAEKGASDQLLMNQFGWKDKSMPRRYTQHIRNRKFLPYSPVAHVRNK